MLINKLAIYLTLEKKEKKANNTKLIILETNLKADVFFFF